MSAVESNLYIQVVRVTDIYLGPAADRFISRQVQNHIHKEPSEFSERDLAKLIDWVRMAFSLITEDTAVVNEYISRLEELTRKPQKETIEHNRVPKAV